VGLRLLVPLEAMQHAAALLEDGGVVGMQLIAESETVEGLLRLLQADEEKSAAEHRVGVARIQFQHLTMAGEGFFQPAQMCEQVAVTAPQLDVTGPELQR